MLPKVNRRTHPIVKLNCHTFPRQVSSEVYDTAPRLRRYRPNTLVSFMSYSIHVFLVGYYRYVTTRYTDTTIRCEQYLTYCGA